MPNRPMLGEHQTLKTFQAFRPCSPQIGKLVFSALAGKRYLRSFTFARHQCHDSVLCGVNSSIEGLLQIIAADFNKLPTFLLATCSLFGLVGATQEVRRGVWIK